MRMPRIAIAAVLLLISSHGLADSALDLGVSADSVRLAYGTLLAGPELNLDVAWLHNDDEGDVLDVGLHALGLAGRSQWLELGVGGRALWVDTDAGDGGALGLGVLAVYPLPRFERLRFAATLHYAPDVVSFGDLEEYLEASASVSYLVVERAQLYVGIRYADAEFEDVPGSVKIDDNVHVGVRIGF